MNPHSFLPAANCANAQNMMDFRQYWADYCKVRSIVEPTSSSLDGVIRTELKIIADVAILKWTPIRIDTAGYGNLKNVENVVAVL